MVDEGRLGELPPGLYGRSYVRAFAGAVGVSADDALEHFGSQLVDVPDPIPAIREIARERTAPTLAALISERVREWYATRQSQPPIKVPGALYLAAGLDALLLFAINAFIVAIAANACHVTPAVLLREAGAVMAVMGGFTAALYFVLLAGIGGQTLGMLAFGTRLRSARRPLDVRAIAERTAEAILGEGSLLMEGVRSRFSQSCRLEKSEI